MKLWGVVGWKNTGKTGLMERLVTEFTKRGLRISTIKHAHHGVDVDQTGTDSFRHRTAGALEVVLASPVRVAVMQELRGAPEPALQDLVARLQPVDLVLVEGFKTENHPKIETHRAAAGQTSAVKRATQTERRYSEADNNRTLPQTQDADSGKERGRARDKSRMGCSEPDG